ncbi:xanthine dehydrogenase accessory protein XdhC [Psychrobacter sp.]|uniref:xanthine dehydrogenase accessory protein XdhC n=1 Tax=Psychrobacter sp. TaxID=56811 RepID=UPI0025D5732A|nr:xanthine dehydrogenase accessory protein XdhC [Psychrobacter sp.]
MAIPLKLVKPFNSNKKNDKHTGNGCHGSKKWYSALYQCQQQGLPHVLVTIVKVSGSVPRDLQAKMVVTEKESYDTIGGGGLEFEVIKTARVLLTYKLPTEEIKGDKNQHKMAYTKHYPLGAKLGQCCGGSVTVLFESFNLKPPLTILLFGAGHVASALVSILAQLNCQVSWIDNRPNIFSPQHLEQLPAHITPYISDDPVEFIHGYNSPSYILIMTHDHSLDFDLVKAAIEMNRQSTTSLEELNNLDQSHALHKSNSPNPSFENAKREPASYIGCIASETKANRFRQRLIQRGFTQADIQSLHMPIGLPIGGKEPIAVAISIMAQVLQQYNQS